MMFSGSKFRIGLALQQEVGAVFLFLQGIIEYLGSDSNRL